MSSRHWTVDTHSGQLSIGLRSGYSWFDPSFLGLEWTLTADSSVPDFVLVIVGLTPVSLALSSRPIVGLSNWDCRNLPSGSPPSEVAAMGVVLL